MRGKKETTTPVPLAVTGGEQSSVHKCSFSIAEKNMDYKFTAGRKHGAGKDASLTLVSIGVVTPQYQIREIWQGPCPLYPVAIGGGAYA